MSRSRAVLMLSEQQNGRERNAQSRSALTSDEIRATLQFLTKRLESHSNSRPVTARNVERHLSRLRAEITDIVRNEARSLCNCRQITVIAGQTPEEFQAEMKLLCLIHGLRRLGIIVHLGSLPPDHNEIRIGELIKTYYRSIAGVRR